VVSTEERGWQSRWKRGAPFIPDHGSSQPAWARFDGEQSCQPASAKFDGEKPYRPALAVEQIGASHGRRGAYFALWPEWTQRSGSNSRLVRCVTKGRIAPDVGCKPLNRHVKAVAFPPAMDAAH